MMELIEEGGDLVLLVKDSIVKVEKHCRRDLLAEQASLIARLKDIENLLAKHQELVVEREKKIK